MKSKSAKRTSRNLESTAKCSKIASETAEIQDKASYIHGRLRSQLKRQGRFKDEILSRQQRKRRESIAHLSRRAFESTAKAYNLHPPDGDISTVKRAFYNPRQLDLGGQRPRKGDRYESGMEVEEMEMQARKRWRIGNGREEVKIDDDDDDGEGDEGMGGVDKEEKGRLLAWQSSRIFRVSRASGGKDRHSKVFTAKGLRDRRIRLSVSTAIQFYDLQDRLRCDQPSKAVEWLIKAAAQAIAKLPPLDGAFPTSPKEEEASDEKRFDPDVETEPTTYLQHQQAQTQSQQQLLSLTKSACSSTSETSKGSVLSLSRSENRVKARERARERTAKEKEKEKESSNLPNQQNANPNTQSSFTDLLTGCNDSASATTIPSATAQNPNPNFIPKQFRNFPPMDYFSPAAIYGQGKNQHAPGFSGQAHFGNPPLSGLPLNLTAAANAVDHPELTQYAFLPEHLISVAAAAATSANTDHNLNFSFSPSLAGFNRGTLQSNSQSSSLPHMQRLHSPIVDAPPNGPFFIGTAASGAAVENPFPTGFDGRLQLCYGDGRRHSDLKGKGKN